MSQSLKGLRKILLTLALALGIGAVFILDVYKRQSMSIPPMISMLIQSMYNVVDSIFVARISEKALTAVSLAYPLQNLILAVAVGYGVGINARCV